MFIDDATSAQKGAVQEETQPQLGGTCVPSSVSKANLGNNTLSASLLYLFGVGETGNQFSPGLGHGDASMCAFTTVSTLAVGIIFIFTNLQ